MNDFFLQKRILALVVFFVSISSFTGCEPLRKKFMRQKKSTISQEALPVLEPIDYPQRVEAPENILRQQYGLWKVWFQEAMNSLQDKSTDKRIRFNLAQLSTQVERLQSLFSGDSVKMLKGYQGRLEKVKIKMDQPEGLRNTDSIRAELISIDKDFRAHFRPEVATVLLSK